ncbi:unnamed protein product [Citrullus colocynthis]|uniref:Beta-glucosidase n=1 Tax=Citrullus colocynthis TaxID=252529 RepID=A0ABP0Z2H3_9ROSI
MAGNDYVYRNPNAAVEDRIKDLLSRLSLNEKVGQMTQVERGVATPSALEDLAIGSVLNGGGSPPFDGALSLDWAKMIDGFQSLALQSRLGIPIIYGIDAVHGNSNVIGANHFPSQYWPRSHQVSKDPRWGRSYESYSEDTEIVRKMTSLVEGLQGKLPEGYPKGYPFVAGRNNVIACAKHYVGDGGTDKGLNEGNTIASYADLEKIHIAPYLDCIAQGVSTIMASYSSWNGCPLHANRFLLTDVLKDKLGFEGFVISDWEALDRLSSPRGSNYRSCIATAINAGIDMVMVPFRYEEFIKELISLVESGEIPMARIDDAVERILRVKFVAGLFEHPFSDGSLLDLVGCKAHRDLAREAVRKSLVLLKNGKDPTKPFLPLDKKAKKILVAGSHADDLGYQCGGWTISWNGSSGRTTIGTTILDAIKEVVGDETEAIYEQNPSAVTLNDKDISFAIVGIGEKPYAEFAGDDSELIIPFHGNDIVKTVAAKIPTLLILISRRPLVLEPTVMENVEALVAAWLPGTEGSGITDAIFGDYDFTGRLPVTWFRTVKQLPVHAENNLQHSLFPLGFG